MNLGRAKQPLIIVRGDGLPLADYEQRGLLSPHTASRKQEREVIVVVDANTNEFARWNDDCENAITEDEGHSNVAWGVNIANVG